MNRRLPLPIALCLLLLGLCLACGKKSSQDSQGASDDAKANQASRKAAEAGQSKLATAAGSPLTIAYSDWPGWVAWEIGIQKGWFRKAGVLVEFKWFDYVPSLDAFSAGQVDAVATTNGDALVIGSSGAQSAAILINDYSNGNDMVVAKPGIESIAQLKGKTVGIETGFVSHLLLQTALEQADLSDKDIKLKNVPGNQTPRALKSGEVDAIVARQPHSGRAIEELPGAQAIFTSAEAPGAIYDVLAVNPKSLQERRKDWVKVVAVWGRIADFLKQEKNLDAAAKLMSPRVGMSADEYEKLIPKAHYLTLEQNLEHYENGNELGHLVFSNKTADALQVKSGVYDKPMPFQRFIDASLVQEALKTKK